MSGRTGIGNFFLIAGIGFVIVGAIAFAGGGMGGSIAGGTFLMIGVIWALVALGLRGFYGNMRKKRAAEQELFQTGTRATATIESVQTTGMVMNDINVQIILSLRVHAAGGQEFIHERKMFVPTFAVPRPGDQIEVAYDPADNNRVALEFDARADTAGGMQLKTRSPGQAPLPAGMQSSSPAPAPEAAAPVDDRSAPEKVIDGLERLSKLKEQGVLSETEFEVQKAKLLSGQIV